MNAQRSIFKLAGMAFLFVVLMSFMLFLHPASAQEGEPSTPTPVESLATPEPMVIPVLEQEVGAQIQSQLQSSLESGGDLAAQVNLSNTTGNSVRPKIAVDRNGNRHVVWQETINGKQEIFYIIGSTQTTPVNVSNSPTFDSDLPQIVADSSGVAHIVWQERDDDHSDDYETHYSKCERVGDQETGYTVACTNPAVLSNGQA